MSKPEISFGGDRVHTLAKKAQWDEFMAEVVANPDCLLSRNQFFATPLHYAFRYGAPTVIILEIIRLAPRKAHYLKNDEGSTPLHLACEFGVSSTTVLALLQTESDLLEKKNKDDMTPLDVARNSKVWPIGLSWHFYRDDYNRVIGIMESPGARQALWEAQRAADYEAVSSADPNGKDVWAEEDTSGDTRLKLRETLSQMDAVPDVYVAVPCDPSLAAAVGQAW